ncbi:MAG TPA: phosphomevalonate kinase, partial [Microbacterium sp.]|nr:phosphomevalonate kinase [Microbacterium sp.]
MTLDAAAPARVVTSTGYKTLTWTPASPGIDVSDEEHGLDYVVAALTVMEDLRRERSIPDGVFALDIDSGLDDGTGRKFGLGSSAAVTVGVVRAVGGHLGLALTPDEEYRLAMLATLSVSPDASGGDVAASTHGGWIFYRSPDREALAAAGALEVERRLRLPAWEVGEIVPIEPPTDLDLVVGWTGAPASTRSLVSAV